MSLTNVLLIIIIIIIAPGLIGVLGMAGLIIAIPICIGMAWYGVFKTFKKDNTEEHIEKKIAAIRGNLPFHIDLQTKRGVCKLNKKGYIIKSSFKMIEKEVTITDLKCIYVETEKMVTDMTLAYLGKSSFYREGQYQLCGKAAELSTDKYDVWISLEKLNSYEKASIDKKIRL